MVHFERAVKGAVDRRGVRQGRDVRRCDFGVDVRHHLIAIAGGAGVQIGRQRRFGEQSQRVSRPRRTTMPSSSTHVES